MKISIKKDIGLGVKDSQPISVSIRTPKQEEVIKKPKITIPVIQKKQEIDNKEIIQFPEIVEPPKQTYGVIHNEQPVIKQEPSKELNKDSIIDKINTGFGCDNALHKECPKPQWHQHLCKENFLGEFKRNYAKTDRQKNDFYATEPATTKLFLDEFIKNLSGVDLSSFITKDDFNEAIQNLDYVKSSLKSNIDYNIPENLFTI